MTDSTPSPRGQRDLAPPDRSLGSHLLHRLERSSESPLASTAATIVCAAFLLVALLAPRATPWLTAFQSLAAAVTLVMVFALQHTQSRHQVALQRKLDEILRVLPGTDPRLVQLEAATEAELAEVSADHQDLRQQGLEQVERHRQDRRGDAGATPRRDP